MDAFIGEIRLFSFNYAPLSWATCNGQLMNITQNQALYSLLSTNFGGDGRTTFALPNMAGRAALSRDYASYSVVGTFGGSEPFALSTTQIPMHSHTLMCVDAPGPQKSPNGAMFAQSGVYQNQLDLPGQNFLNNQALGTSGGNNPHENRQPFLVLNYCISLSGYYPSRS